MGRIQELLAHVSTACLACVVLAAVVAGQTVSPRNGPLSPRPATPVFLGGGPLGGTGQRGVPPAPVHSCAEWEESEGIILNYNWMNADTVYKMQLDHQVYIPVDNPKQRRDWVHFLNANGIPHTNIHFIMIPLTYGWMRDCGPWFIWDGNGELCIVNNSCWHDNYPLDDQFPRKFAAQFGYKYYEPHLEIYSEGGNYYPNAYGIAFSSSWVYGDNGAKSKALTDSLFRDYLGIERYHTVPPYTLSHHDTCGKPANPETLIIAQWPEGYWKHPLGEGIAAYYATLESPWGRPYRIHRTPMFPAPWVDFKPYLNCLVANEKVFIPVTGTPDDEIALSIFRQAFAGYEIVGIDHFGSGWGASLHCATKNIMKRDIIRIYPYPPGDAEATGAAHPVRAEVIPLPGSTLRPGYPVIHWTPTGGDPFQDVVMLPTGQPNEYQADIPAQPQGTTVSFYIEARDNGGLTAVYPLVAPEGMMTFEVREDVAAPEVTRFIPTRSASAGSWPPLVRTLCKDDMATPQVVVEYAINGVPQPDAHLVREEMCYWYSGTLGGSAAAGDVISYRLKATDGAQTENVSSLPREGEIFCPVVEASGSVGIVNLSLRPCTAPFLLDAFGDLGIPHHYYREWPSSFAAHDAWFICLGVFPYNHILSTAQANEVVAALQSGKNIYLEGGDTWSYDAVAYTLGPWFGVQPFWRGFWLDSVVGAKESFLRGLTLDYGDQFEDLCLDWMTEVPPAQPLLRWNKDTGNPLGVVFDAGGYRSIACSVPLGGLVDRGWPNTRKEILLRYLEFFGQRRPQLMASGVARPGQRVPLRLEAQPGDEYLLVASLAEDYQHLSNGVFRLSSDHLFPLDRGVVPAAGVLRYDLLIPQDDALLGVEVHLKALIGDATKPTGSYFTNREILTVVE